MKTTSPPKSEQRCPRRRRTQRTSNFSDHQFIIHLLQPGAPQAIEGQHKGPALPVLRPRGEAGRGHPEASPRRPEGAGGDLQWREAADQPPQVKKAGS